jgi:homoserine dehydrogenase
MPSTIQTRRLALIGFGTVGQGLAEVLQSNGAALAASHSFQAIIVAVSDLQKGAVYHPDGLDLAALLEAGRQGDLARYADRPGLVRGLDSLATIRQTIADTLIEVSYTDLKTGEPAFSHIRAAFEAGKNAITTNKGPVALGYRALAEQASRQGLFFGYEGTVMSGTPSLRLARTALVGCTITEVRGILNGTTNFMLTAMENGATYAAALAEAQRLGYAEADPTGDVEGIDAAGKLVIIAKTILGTTIGMEDVARTGITGLKPADITAARAAGERWKLIARARRAKRGLVASVKPERLPLSDPLAGVGGVTNAITYETDLLGPVTLIGAGAGRRETGFAILSDLLELARQS